MYKNGASTILIPQNFVKVLLIGLALGAIGLIDIGNFGKNDYQNGGINTGTIADRQKLTTDRNAYRNGMLNSETAQNLCTTIEVPVWRFKSGKSGEKVSSTIGIVINKELAGEVTAIFTEIYNNPEKFPIHGAGGFYWTETGTGNHQTGSAIDINVNENYYVGDGIVGSFWMPGVDPLSMPRDGSVVRTFKKYGWDWGGDWSYPLDYMHFSCLGG